MNEKPRNRKKTNFNYQESKRNYTDLVVGRLPATGCMALYSPCQLEPVRPQSPQCRVRLDSNTHENQTPTDTGCDLRLSHCLIHRRTETGNSVGDFFSIKHRF